MKQPYVYSMPENFLKDKSVPARWRVLAVINGFIINGGCFYGSNEWLMEQLDCSEQTVSNAFKELEESGDVYVERTRRTRNVYRSRPKPVWVSDPSQPRVSDPSSFGTNSVSNSVIEIVAERDEEPKKKESRKLEKEQVFRLFSEKPEPWWVHKQQKVDALNLFDSLGMDSLKKKIRYMREHKDDPYCPQAHTPTEFAQKLPKLTAYHERNR